MIAKTYGMTGTKVKRVENSREKLQKNSVHDDNKRNLHDSKSNSIHTLLNIQPLSDSNMPEC